MKAAARHERRRAMSKPLRHHFRSIEAYLLDRGWREERKGVWASPLIGNDAWRYSEVQALGKQLERDCGPPTEDQTPWKVVGITLEVVG